MKSTISILGGLIFLMAGASALAHSFPSSSQPSAGATVAAAPTNVTIHFDNPIEAMFATLTVFDSNGAEVDSGPATLAANRRDLSAPLKPLANGEYTVKWNVVGRDSHRTQGSFTFSVAPRAAP